MCSASRSSARGADNLTTWRLVNAGDMQKAAAGITRSGLCINPARATERVSAVLCSVLRAGWVLSRRRCSFLNGKRHQA